MLRYFFLIISGLASGFLTAAAYVAFIAVLGIFPKIAAKTKTANQCILYENCLMLGILTSTLLQFCVTYASAGIPEPARMPDIIGCILLSAIGLFGGLYIGFLIGGLSEVLNVIPIFARKAHIKKNLNRIIIYFAIGKGIFTLIQFFYFNV